MKSLYVQGDGPLHRTPAGPKLVALILFGLLLFLTRNPLLLTLGLAAAGLAYFILGQSLASALRPLRAVMLTIVIVGLFNLAFVSPDEALVTVLRLTALVLAAAAVTATTPIGALIDTVTVAATPLERIGLMRAADIGLAVGLVLRFLPEILNRYEALKLAHRARGLKPRVTTLLVPLVIQTLKDADAIADAIDARGIRRS